MTKKKWIQVGLGLAAGATLLSGGCTSSWWIPVSVIATVVAAYVAGTLYNPNP